MMTIKYSLRLWKFVGIVKFLTVAFLIALGFNSFGQVDNQQLLFEEVHRFVGYENIPMRYLTLPVDLSMNSNVEGNFVDMSLLLLIFLPLLLLLFSSRKILPFLTSILVLVFTLTAYFYHSSFLLGFEKIENSDLSATGSRLGDVESNSFFINTGYSLRTMVLDLTGPLFESIDSITSTERTFIVYPFLILILIGGIYTLIKYTPKKWSGTEVRLWLFVALFTFLWFLLGGGILWYGFTGIVLLFLLPMDIFNRGSSLDVRRKTLFWIFSISIGLWLSVAWIYKGTNIYYAFSEPNMLMDYPIMQYHSGKMNESQVNDSYFKNLSTAIDEINRGRGNVYRVGTMFPYFIKSNHNRLYNDNLVSFFPKLQTKYDNQTIVSVLKANGFTHIVFGLNVAALDKTPDQSLRGRFNEFLTFIYQNPGLELIATDNLVQGQNGGNVYEVFGESVRSGTYAVYRIK